MDRRAIQDARFPLHYHHASSSSRGAEPPGRHARRLAGARAVPWSLEPAHGRASVAPCRFRRDARSAACARRDEPSRGGRVADPFFPGHRRSRRYIEPVAASRRSPHGRRHDEKGLLGRHSQARTRVDPRDAGVVAEPNADHGLAAAREDDALLSRAFHDRGDREGRLSGHRLAAEPALPVERAGKFARLDAGRQPGSRDADLPRQRAQQQGAS